MRSSFVAVVLAALVVVAALAAVAVAATPVSDSVAQSGDDPGPGVRLGGAVGVERAAVDGRVAVERLDARLAAAGSDAARAAVLDEHLSASTGRVAELEARADEVGGAGGAGDPGATARAATVAADARALDAVLARVERAVAALPADERERYDLGGRTDALRERAGALVDRFAAQSAVVDGAGVANTTADRADVVAAYENALADGPGVVRSLFGDERIVVRVHEGDGTTNVYSLRTEGGRVVAATDGALADPTVRVAAEGAVVQHLARTDDPGGVFDAARDRDALTYDGVGALNWAKFEAVGVAEGIADLLGD